jgi:nucleotide-binding universal stress UspA family protein
VISAPTVVLAAIDFSDASARAIAVAGFIARACDARLTLLHAESIEAPVYFTTEQLDGLERQRRASRAAVEASVARFGREHTPTSFSVIVREQPPMEAILGASASADLVVMGTHGRHGPARWWLGSLAEKVSQDISKPLLVVRADLHEPLDALFARAVVLGASRSAGSAAKDYARVLAACCRGATFDERGIPVEQALDRSRPTIAVVARPHGRNEPHAADDAGRLLARSRTMPLLFVPEFPEGGTS